MLTVAAAQLGPVQRHHTREQVVERLIALLRDAHAHEAAAQTQRLSALNQQLAEQSREIARAIETLRRAPGTRPGQCS